MSLQIKLEGGKYDGATYELPRLPEHLTVPNRVKTPHGWTREDWHYLPDGIIKGVFHIYRFDKVTNP